MRNLLVLLALVACAFAQQPPPASGTESMYQAQARSAQGKFDYIRANAAKATPNPRPISLSESELNSWLSSNGAQLPQGVKRLQVRSEPGIIHAIASVDFDQITAGRKSSNPFLSMFSGTHSVEAEAHAEGSGGEGRVHIDSVSLDGVEIPRMALQYFADKYITPKHPGIGLDSTFALPYRIESALVGSHQLTLIQK